MLRAAEEFDPFAARMVKNLLAVSSADKKFNLIDIPPQSVYTAPITNHDGIGLGPGNTRTQLSVQESLDGLNLSRGRRTRSASVRNTLAGAGSGLGDKL